MITVSESIKLLIAPSSSNGQRMSGAMGIIQAMRSLELEPLPDEDWILKQNWLKPLTMPEIIARWHHFQHCEIKYFDALKILSSRAKKADRILAATKMQAAIYQRAGEIISRSWILDQDWDYDPAENVDQSIAMVIDDYHTDLAKARYILPEHERYIVMLEQSNDWRQGLQRVVDSLSDNLQQTNAVLDEALRWIQGIHGDTGPGVDEIRGFLLEAIAGKNGGNV